MKNLIFIPLFVVLLACNPSPKKSAELGVVNLEVQSTPAAAAAFNTGLLLLHSFEYEDACESFDQAIAIDSTLAMAYWGRAMTFNHPIWQKQDQSEAVNALKACTRAGAEPNTDLEADFLKSLEILYEEGVEKEIRDKNYAEFYAEMSERYPNNHEVQSFYALALLGSVEDGRDVVVYEKAGAIAAQIVKENPKHPGALHYLIHAYDDPAHAELAMEAAETYAKVAPAAGHALHMPSHIFVAQGMWDEVVASNIDSYQASVDRMKSKNLDNDARGYHAYHWLEYGYLQRGEFEIAADMLDSMVVYAAATPSKQSRSYLVRLQGTYLVETNAWDGPYADIQVDGSDLSFYIKTKHYFVEAMKSYTERDVDSLRATRDLLEASIRRESLFADTIDFKLCIPSDLSAATPSDIAISKAVLFQLYALEYMLSGQNELAEDYLVKSTELEDSIDYSYGPPGIQKPTHELYADWLLSQKRNEEAVLHYEKELLRAPGRRLSRLGKTEAMKRISTAQTAGL